MSNYPPIAVVGVSALYPGSLTAGRFWQNILEGNDLFSDVPPSHWRLEDYYDPDPMAPDKTYARRGGFLPEIDFPSLTYGLPPNIAPATDSAQLLALVVAQRVLEDAARGDFSEMDRERISVILGVASATELTAHMAGRLQKPVWERTLREMGLGEDEVERFGDRIAENYVPWQESTFPGLLGNVVAGRIANRLDLGGTNCVVDAACASSFAALEMALNELYLGQSDLVITGGVDALNDILMFMCFSKTTALSVSGDCRPFSDQADGTMLGEGVGMVALKRLDEAERDGDPIYAVLRGLGSSSDGRAKSIYAPVPSGQAKALRRAYENAGYGPETVELVEAHGTATKAGDAAEFSALRDVFDASDREDRQWCGLGSVKSQIGHTKAAAGVAGLFKVVMALHHKVLPPTIKVDRPSPALELEESPFYLNTAARPWIKSGETPRRASVSAFGFGGTNFHIALEEYTGAATPASRFRTTPTELFVFAEETPAALAERLLATREALTPEGFRPLAHTSQTDFDPAQPARTALVATDADDLAAKLSQVIDHLGKQPEAPFETPTGVVYALGAESGQVAFLFPGQGSQYVGMGGDVAIAFDAARDAWDAAAAQPFDGEHADEHVGTRVFPRPAFTDEERAAQAERLTATDWAQPAIGVTSWSVLNLLRALGAEPDCVGGHSYGEVTALAAAGALSEADLLRVARRRGELMAEAAQTPGAMTAVSADRERVDALLEEASLDVVVANHNHPTQVVLSGSVAAVEAAEAALKEAGLSFRRLPVATAFHSSIVSPSVEPFRAFLGEVDVTAPRVPVYANAEAAPYPEDADAIRDGLAGQIARPVRFVEQIEAMYEAGVRTFVEVGPHAVLTGLVGRTLGDRPHRAIATDRKGRHGVTSLWQALGQLAVAGVPLRFEALWQGVALDPAPEPDAKPAFTIPVGGANYGKPQLEPLASSNGASSDGATAPADLTPSPAPSSSSPDGAPAPDGPTPSPSTETTPTMSQTNGQNPAAPANASSDGAAAQTTYAAHPQVQQAWIQAFQALQDHTVHAHMSYQQSMAQSHSAFLQMAQASFQHLAQMVGGAPAAMPPSLPALPPAAMQAPAPQPMAAPQPSYQPVYPTPQPAPAPQPQAWQQPAPMPQAQPAPMPQPPAPQPQAPAPQPVPQAQPQAQPAPAPQPQAQPAPPPQQAAPAPAPQPEAPAAEPETEAAPAVDLVALMLEVVAEQTGYPEEMLDLSMALEADLGIDSIKRVQILAAFQERVPNFPEIEARDMASLQTLQEIVDFIQERLDAEEANAPF